MTVVLDRRKRNESPIDRWVKLADKVLRGTCQWMDCEQPADLSSNGTSLAYCEEHFKQYEKERWQHLEYQHLNRSAE